MPADEFERRRREALEQGVDQWQSLPGFLQFVFLLIQSFLAALNLGDIFHALVLVPILQEQQEVVNVQFADACARHWTRRSTRAWPDWREDNHSIADPSAQLLRERPDADPQRANKQAVAGATGAWLF